MIKTREIKDFFNLEYKQQAQNANFTKLSNLMGYKPTANKVLNTMLAKNITDWQKVEVIANVTALDTLYMGGSTNIEGVIVNASIDYVGSNNISLIETKGDFGGRLNTTPAASRYIFARKGTNFSKYFNTDDLNVLPRYNFEGQDIEYQFLTFNIPMLLVNGSEGMGSGHAQKILPRNPNELIKYLKYNLKGRNTANKPFKNVPYFEGFSGTVKQGETPNQWIMTGTFKILSSMRIEITEVPIGERYISYGKKLDKLVDNGTIRDYEDLCDPKTDTFKYIVKVPSSFTKLSTEKIIDKLKLQSKISENYTIIDEHNSVKVHKSINDIFWHYYKIKLYFLEKRKEYLIDKLNFDIRFNNSKYLFIKGIVEETIKINKQKKDNIIKQLDTFENILEKDDSYDYLLNMTIHSLTAERMAKLQADIKTKKAELKIVKSTSLENMWLEDLE